MARAKKAAATAKSTPARRGGRPSNASIAERNASAQRNFIEMVSAAASAAARGAVEAAIGGGVTTIGTPQSLSASGNTQTATSRRGGSATSTSATKAKQAPGRRPDPNSKLSKSKEIYAANVGKMERNDIVNLMVSKLGIDKSVANTYYHTIHRKAGGTSTRRSPAKKAIAA